MTSVMSVPIGEPLDAVSIIWLDDIIKFGGEPAGLIDTLDKKNDLQHTRAYRALSAAGHFSCWCKNWCNKFECGVRICCIFFLHLL